MLELGVGADLVRGVGWILWGLIALGLWLAVSKPKTLAGKVICTALVLAVPVAILGPAAYRGYEYRKRYEVAKAHFDERCKAAGEKINRTVDNVDGVIWMKWRPAGLNREQFTIDDPYGKDCSMEGCIFRLLRGNEMRGSGRDSAGQPSHGYRFVETIDPRDGILYRYSASFKNIADVPKEQFAQHVRRTGHGAEADGRFLELQREPVGGYSARFGIAWEDVSTPEDRRYWIAGGVLRVIDLETGEIIAQRLGYLIDTGQGSTAGARDPWGWAKSYAPQCPVHHESTWNFVMRILQPVKN